MTLTFTANVEIIATLVLFKHRKP